MDKLYEKDTFYNTNIFYLFNRDIIEYDLKDAGFSISKEFNYLTEEEIKRYSAMSKDKRKKQLGILQRDNDIYKENLKEGFIEARKRFFEANKLEIGDIIDIRKDAIFTSRRCDTEIVGKYLNFREKNHYTSFIRLSRTIEVFYGDTLDVKGISENKVLLHKDFMLKVIENFMRRMETEDKTEVIDYLRRFTDKYKWRELELGYYRSFDSQSEFVFNSTDDVVVSAYDSDIYNINIDYNYENVLLKLLKIPL